MIPRSILKKPTSPPAEVAAASATPREERNREVALQHAHLIQQQKDTEAQILASIEALLDVPSSSTADTAHPSASDAAYVKKALRSFRPSDYDDLIQERNVSRQCGYVLCPRANKKQDTKARFRILQDRGNTSDALKVVSTQSLEKWCSDDCGKRALYIKVQLNEEPAWTRIDPSRGDIILLEDKQASENETAALVEGMSNLDVDLGEDRVVQRLKALAIERGDGNVLTKPRGLVGKDVQENTITDSTKWNLQNQPGVIADSYGLIEGYEPCYSARASRGNDFDEDQDDMLPTI